MAELYVPDIPDAVIESLLAKAEASEMTLSEFVVHALGWGSEPSHEHIVVELSDYPSNQALSEGIQP